MANNHFESDAPPASCTLALRRAMKRIRRFIFITVAVLVAGYALLMAYTWWDFLPRTVLITFPEERELDEASAIEVSKRALVEVTHFDARELQPASYRHNESVYFAKNVLNENRGYVLWKVGSGERLFHYSVVLEREGPQISASVAKAE